MEVSIFAAFVAGLVSFLSPCVLPLVPGYISMFSGIGVEQLKGRQCTARRVAFIGCGVRFWILDSFYFVRRVGQRSRNFFCPQSEPTGTARRFINCSFRPAPRRLAGEDHDSRGLDDWRIARRRGVSRSHGIPAFFGGWLKAIHFFSVSLIFLLGPSLTRWLNRDVHFRKLGGQPGAVSGFLMGFAFAFGWTPCIGPILAGVLAIAATRETVGQGIFLLACYSAGLAIPFLVTALGISGFLRFYQKFRRHLHTVEVFSGVLLLAVGGLVFLNRLTWLSGKLTFLNRFSW